ncbi:MAG: hypothetical protein ACLR3S_07645 [Clostridium fessum]
MLGNSLGLENTRFIAWNRLAGGEVCVRAIEDSPIPPGYFAGICRKDGQAAKVESVSSPEKIRAYVESGSWKQADLLELLYCRMDAITGMACRQSERKLRFMENA